MCFRYCLVGFALGVFPLFLSGQKVVRISGQYLYQAPKTVSPAQAERIAVERARLQALSDAFGTCISDVTTTVMKSRDGKSDIGLQKITESEVKGVWLSDEKAARVEFVGFQDDMMVYRAEVWGWHER